MKQVLLGVLLSMMLLFGTQNIFAQDKQEEERIKVFINCTAGNCHEAFLITELSFFDFVRDRFQADVQILTVAQTNAAGGQKYTLKFIGGKRFLSIKDSAEVNTGMTDSDDMVRNELLSAVKKGLLPFVLATNLKSEVQIEYPKRLPEELIREDDKWHNWVFTLGTEGNFEGESQRNASKFSAYAGIYKITHKNKFVWETWYEYSRNRFTLDNITVNVPVKNFGTWLAYAHSLSEHWSLGVLGEWSYDEFANIASMHKITPAIEYNIYPYSQNTRRQLRLAYQVGYRHFRYFEETVFDKEAETRSFHQLSAVAVYTQTWGSINGLLQARSFMNNFSQNRVSAQLALNLRLFEGFNLTFQGAGSVINDQISLSKSSGSEEEFLLRGKQLPTSFLYETRFGFTFTFGSTNSSVVNPRFERIDE
jgi:hypothetical protein